MVFLELYYNHKRVSLVELYEKAMPKSPEEMTSKDIRRMSEEELLDMDYFLMKMTSLLAKLAFCFSGILSLIKAQGQASSLSFPTVPRIFMTSHVLMQSPQNVCYGHSHDTAYESR